MATASRGDLPQNSIIVARNMGPAELLDYDRTKLRGGGLEEGGKTSHVAIVARALGIPAIGQAEGIIDLVAVMGYYDLVSMVLNVDRYPLPAGAALPFAEPR